VSVIYKKHTPLHGIYIAEKIKLIFAWFNFKNK